MSLAETAAFQAKVDRVERALKAKVESDCGFSDEATQAAKLMAVFRAYDSDRSGFLSPEEFAAALVKLNFVGVQREVKGLFDRYDSDGSNLISYEEFAAGIYNLIPNVTSDPETRSAVERVKLKIAERGGLNGIRTLAKIMATMDTSGDRKLDREELKWGLRDYGVALSERELDTVLNAFDKNKDGRIDFDEFLRGIRGNLSARRRALILMAFERLDKDGSGEVTLSDVAAAYDTSKHPDVLSGKKSRDTVLGEFMSQWDSGTKDGVITKDEFLDYYKDVSASVDTDDYFELMIRNAWHISGGEGAYENTSARRVLVVHSDGSEEVVEIKDDLGVRADDLAEMRRRLTAQGVKDIARIELSF